MVGGARLIFDFGVCGREDLCPIFSSVQFFPTGSSLFLTTLIASFEISFADPKKVLIRTKTVHQGILDCLCK